MNAMNESKISFVFLEVAFWQARSQVEGGKWHGGPRQAIAIRFNNVNKCSVWCAVRSMRYGNR